MGTRNGRSRGTGGGEPKTSGAIVLLDQDAAFRDRLQDALGTELRITDRMEPAPSAPVLAIIVDLLPVGLTGLAPIAEFRTRHPNAALVVLARYDHHYQETHALLDRIADAVVLKPVDLDSLACTIRLLANGAAASAEPPRGYRKEER